MILSTILTTVLLGQSMLPRARIVYVPVPPYIPAAEQFEDYPLQVRVLEAHWKFSRGEYIGYGRVDVLGSTPEGADFNYDCPEPFKTNDVRGEFYGAKWKKPETQLELVLQKVGSKHTELCTLKVTVRPAYYRRDSETWLAPAPPPMPAPLAPPAAAQPAPAAAPILRRPPE